MSKSCQKTYTYRKFDRQKNNPQSCRQTSGGRAGPKHEFKSCENTGDINMSNLHNDGNEVDGSKGSWSIQEGADDLFIINRVSGKKYKFNLTEIS